MFPILTTVFLEKTVYDIILYDHDDCRNKQNKAIYYGS